jgi:D-lactate dehydrogenase
MKIAVFEIEEWEKEYLKSKLGEHALTFHANPLTDALIDEFSGIEALSVFIDSHLTRELLEKLPDLQLITTRSTGYDHIDLEYCKEKNITVCTVPEYGTHTVAEHTFALILALSRRLIPSVERARRGDFSLSGLTGFDLYHKTLGIVGLGNIGTAVARIAKGFGMNVLVYSRHPDAKRAEQIGYNYGDLEHLLRNSDILSLHVPLTPETKHMINKDNIHSLKKGSILINTARGGLIDTEAILLGLQEKILQGVGIDVLEEEVNIKEERQLLSETFLAENDIKTQLLNHVLLTRDEVIVTPHNAFNSFEALYRILDVTLENITGFINQTPKNIITVQAG